MEATPEKRPDDSPGKDRLIEVTLQLILETGVRGVRMQDVAKLAGVSSSLIYYHFGTRQGLINETFVRSTELGTSDRIQELLDAGASGAEAIEKTIFEELPFTDAQRRAGVVWDEVMALGAFEDAVRDGLRNAVVTWRGHLAEGIRVGQEDGSVRSDIDPEATAEMLSSLVDGLTDRCLAGVLSKDEVRDVMQATLSAQLRPPARPRGRQKRKAPRTAKTS